MDLLVSLEQRFSRLPDGSVWSPSVYSHTFWGRYLDVFDGVRVVSRVADARSVPVDWVRSDGDGVSFVAVPHYRGPWQYLIRGGRVRRAVRRAVADDGAVLMRVGSQLAAILEAILRGSGHPYGLEVVGDPYSTFSPGAVRHPLRPFLRWWLTWQLQQHCRGASSVAYVTERALQDRYPARIGTYIMNYSSIELRSDAFAAAPRPRRTVGRQPKLLAVGSLSQLYKGFDVLIDSVARCARLSLQPTLVILGDGVYLDELKRRAARSGLSATVRFLGHVPAGQAVREQLDRADLFIMPSRTEGLPRALIEAMARGLPCIGSDVGGIPELLPPEDLVPPGDSASLARKMIEVLSDPGRMARMSACNLTKAGEYRDELLANRRRAHYRYLREHTEAWLNKRRNR